LNATCVFAMVELPGVARYRAMVSTGVGGGSGVEERESRPGFSFRGEPKRLRRPDLAGEVGAAGVGLCFSCSALRMWGSRRMSRERENSKLGCSTLHWSALLTNAQLHVQGELLVDLRSVREHGIWCPDIVYAVVEGDAEHCLLLW